MPHSHHLNIFNYRANYNSNFVNELIACGIHEGSDMHIFLHWREDYKCRTTPEVIVSSVNTSFCPVSPYRSFHKFVPSFCLQQQNLFARFPCSPGSTFLSSTFIFLENPGKYFTGQINSSLVSRTQYIRKSRQRFPL